MANQVNWLTATGRSNPPETQRRRAGPWRRMSQSCFSFSFRTIFNVSPLVLGFPECCFEPIFTFLSLLSI